VSYPAEINNLPSPPRQDLDYNGKDIYAFITQVSPIKSTWDSAINEIVVVKQGEDGKFTKIYEIPNSDKAVTFDSVLFINEDYLIYNFMSYKNGILCITSAYSTSRTSTNGHLHLHGMVKT